MPIQYPNSLAGGLRHRLRPHLAAVVQTALAALAAWWVAIAVLPAEQPAFASIAAVISLGIAHGRRTRRAIELVGGVVLGITVGSVLFWLLGTGPLQIGLLVVLAMLTALLLRAGDLVVSEAAISAILLAAFHRTGAEFSADRFLEAVIGGTVALVVAALVFPPRPARMAGEAARGVLDRLGATLQDLAAALAAGDAVRAQDALRSARAIDGEVEALEDLIDAGVETARMAPARRRDVEVLRRYEQALPQIDFAVRNTRVLARHASRHLRAGGPVPGQLVGAVELLADAVRALAALFDGGGRPDCPRHFALNAAWGATSAREDAPGLAEVAAQVRLVAVDLVRAADSLAQNDLVALEDSTEELLAARPAAVGS